MTFLANIADPDQPALDRLNKQSDLFAIPSTSLQQIFSVSYFFPYFPVLNSFFALCPGNNVIKTLLYYLSTQILSLFNILDYKLKIIPAIKQEIKS